LPQGSENRSPNASADLGLSPGQPPTNKRKELRARSNGVGEAVYRDPDGNELGFGGAPLDIGSST
jgi:hypothetical protein